MEQIGGFEISWAMEVRKTALERAFELARSGNCLPIRDIAHKLNSEKYDISHLEGSALRKQLQTLIDEANNRNSR